MAEFVIPPVPPKGTEEFEAWVAGLIQQLNVLEMQKSVFGDSNEEIMKMFPYTKQQHSIEKALADQGIAVMYDRGTWREDFRSEKPLHMV